MINIHGLFPSLIVFLLANIEISYSHLFPYLSFKVLYANQEDHIGLLIYVQNLWEYPPGRYSIIGGICLLLVLVGLVTLFIFCKRRRHVPKRRRALSSAQSQLDLVRRVKRWSRISPRPWSTFIPSGPRQASNFMGTMSDVSTNVYHSRTSPLDFEEISVA